MAAPVFGPWFTPPQPTGSLEARAMFQTRPVATRGRALPSLGNRSFDLTAVTARSVRQPEPVDSGMVVARSGGRRGQRLGRLVNRVERDWVGGPVSLQH